MALHPVQRPCPEHDLSTRTDREFSYRVPFTESGRGVIDEVYPLIWLSPAWLFWIPFQILQFAGAVRAQVGLTWGDWLCYGLLFAVFVLCLATLVMCLDHELEISITGLRAPLRFLPALSLRCFRRWHDLSAMRLREVPKKTGMARTLQFVFASGGAFSLEVEGISREDLKKLVLSVQTYSPAAEISNLLPDLDLGIPLDGSSCDTTSFTKLWDDEFARRFGSTLFVPREAGSELQAGNLKVIRQLAFGGLSATYLAVRRDGQMVVLKESAVPVHADPKLKAKAEELFRREATLLGLINHPNIARCLDYFIEDGRHYLVLEYVGGQDLRHFVTDNGPQPEDIALRWAIETCEILVYLHGLDPPIVHRDLTPDNLVLKADGTLALIDFGAANVFVGTMTGTMIGKQCYISPEQFRGKSGPQSDIYSLGCCVNFFLTGCDPEPLSRSHPRAACEEVSPQLDDLIARCTEPQVSARLSTAPELLAMLTELSGK